MSKDEDVKCYANDEYCYFVEEDKDGLLASLFPDESKDHLAEEVEIICNFDNAEKIYIRQTARSDYGKRSNVIELDFQQLEALLHVIQGIQ